MKKASTTVLPRSAESVTASRYGLLRGPLRLSDFRGQTVIVAFFPKARTKG